MCSSDLGYFFFSSRRRHTRCADVTGVQTCALPISLILFTYILNYHNGFGQARAGSWQHYAAVERRVSGASARDSIGGGQEKLL